MKQMISRKPLPGCRVCGKPRHKRERALCLKHYRWDRNRRRVRYYKNVAANIAMANSGGDSNG